MENLKSSLVGGIKWLVVVNVAQKLITFTMNQALILWTSPEIYGIASIQFELLLSSLLFLSRDGIRLAVLRLDASKESQRLVLVNMSWLPCLLIIIFSFGLAAGRSLILPETDLRLFLIYCLSAFLECCGEPLLNFFLNRMDLGAKIKAETSAIFFRSLVTFLLLVYSSFGILSFAIAQLVYSFAYLITLISHLSTFKLSENIVDEVKLKDFLPSYSSGSLVNQEVLSVAIAASTSTVFKHLLTEGDKIVLTLFSSSYNQGIYALTNNYGSLVARMIFLPLEDSSRLMFSKYASKIQFKNSKIEKNGETLKELETMESLLISLLRFVGLFGCCFVVFGIPYVPIFARFILRNRWNGNETIITLQVYCFYIFVLGINGISEAFVQAYSPSSVFAELNTGLIYSWLVFMVLAVLGISFYGTPGVIMANIGGMITRIIMNGIVMEKLINKSLKDFHTSDKQINKNKVFKSLIPPFQWVLIVLICGFSTVVSSWIYSRSPQALVDAFIHIGCGGLIGIWFLIGSALTAPSEEKQFFKEIVLGRLKLPKSQLEKNE